jgi:hypothetical protein
MWRDVIASYTCVDGYDFISHLSDFLSPKLPIIPSSIVWIDAFVLSNVVL